MENSKMSTHMPQLGKGQMPNLPNMKNIKPLKGKYLV